MSQTIDDDCSEETTKESGPSVFPHFSHATAGDKDTFEREKDNLILHIGRELHIHGVPLYNHVSIIQSFKFPSTIIIYFIVT